jgi:RNA polymerase sigma-70 factor (ECF subfamily)
MTLAPRSDPGHEHEAALIGRIQRGERELFYELIRPYERRVFVIAFTILRNEADAEDVAQDAFLKAFKYLAQFRSESRFSTWLIQVAINEARQRQRKSHLEIMRPIADQENEDGTYTPRDFTDWREIPSCFGTFSLRDWMESGQQIRRFQRGQNRGRKLRACLARDFELLRGGC